MVFRRLQAQQTENANSKPGKYPNMTGIRSVVGFGGSCFKCVNSNLREKIVKRISHMPAVEPSVLVDRVLAAGVLVIHRGESHPVGGIIGAIVAGVLYAFGLWEL